MFGAVAFFSCWLPEADAIRIVMNTECDRSTLGLALTSGPIGEFLRGFRSHLDRAAVPSGCRRMADAYARADGHTLALCRPLPIERQQAGEDDVLGDVGGVLVRRPATGGPDGAVERVGQPRRAGGCSWCSGESGMDLTPRVRRARPYLLALAPVTITKGFRPETPLRIAESVFARTKGTGDGSIRSSSRRTCPGQRGPDGREHPARHR
jgi:hypothetical protein